MTEDFDEQPSQQDEWKKYAALASRRRWHLLLPFFAGWLLVWGASWFLPSVYRSSTLILVPPPTVSGVVASTASSDLQDRLDSIQQQILSRTRLLRIIDHLNLYSKLRTRLTPDDMVEKMRKDIQIELVRSPGKQDLSAFNIYFKSDNPYTAQQVTNELATILITENIEVGEEHTGNTIKFLDSQLEEARASLTAQEAKVREFKDRHLGELPGQLGSNLQILTGLQNQLQAEQDALGRAKQQNAYFESLLTQYKSTATTGKPGDPPVGLAGLNQELDRLKAQLADLTSRYTDQHPDVRKVREQIARTEKAKQQLIAELKAKGADTTVPVASDYSGKEIGPIMEVESQLKGNQIEISNRQRAVTDLEAKIDEYQARLNRSPVREQELADITRDYDQSRANYDSLLAKRNSAQLTGSLEKRTEGTLFRMIDPPSLPTKPFSPNRFLLSLGGLFGGLALGVASALAADQMDDRVYDEEDFKKLLPVPIMAEIPPLPTVTEQAVQRQQLWLEWGAAALICTITLAGTAFSYLRG
jgi:succinoglycan biosynthesis transport protein ExoP